MSGGDGSGRSSEARVRFRLRRRDLGDGQRPPGVHQDGRFAETRRDRVAENRDQGLQEVGRGGQETQPGRIRRGGAKLKINCKALVRLNRADWQ